MEPFDAHDHPWWHPYTFEYPKYYSYEYLEPNTQITYALPTKLAPTTAVAESKIVTKPIKDVLTPAEMDLFNLLGPNFTKVLRVQLLPVGRGVTELEDGSFTALTAVVNAPYNKPLALSVSCDHYSTVCCSCITKWSLRYVIRVLANQDPVELVWQHVPKGVPA